MYVASGARSPIIHAGNTRGSTVSSQPILLELVKSTSCVIYGKYNNNYIYMYVASCARSGNTRGSTVWSQLELVKSSCFFLFQPHDSTIDVNWQSNWSDSMRFIAKSVRHRLLRLWWRGWEFSIPRPNLVLFWGGVSNDCNRLFA